MLRVIALLPFLLLAFQGDLYAVEKTVLDHTVRTLAGEEIRLADEYGDKVVLFVNVASRCGHTPQYKPLEELSQKYADQGLVVIGVPCNQFGSQEPGTAEQIAAFCEKNYGVTFVMLDKVNVNMPEQCDLYQDLTQAKPAGPVKWNFEKFLVSREGFVVGRYPSRVQPNDPNLVADIERELAVGN